MYGWWESVATKASIRQVTGERGLVLTRSTFPGKAMTLCKILVLNSYLVEKALGTMLPTGWETTGASGTT